MDLCEKANSIVTLRDNNNAPLLSKFQPVLRNYLANMNLRDFNSVVAEQKKRVCESFDISFISPIEDGFNDLSLDLNPQKERQEMKFSARGVDCFKDKSDKFGQRFRVLTEICRGAATVFAETSTVEAYFS